MFSQGGSHFPQNNVNKSILCRKVLNILENIFETSTKCEYRRSAAREQCSLRSSPPGPASQESSTGFVSKKWHWDTLKNTIKHELNLNLYWGMFFVVVFLCCCVFPSFLFQKIMSTHRNKAQTK